jgi:hypothetical protein
MVILGRLRVEGQGINLKSGKQHFDIALQIKERQWPGCLMDPGNYRTAGRPETNLPILFRLPIYQLKHIP